MNKYLLFFFPWVGLACGGFGVEELDNAIAEVPDSPNYDEHVSLIMARACNQCHSPGAERSPNVWTSQYEDSGEIQGVFSLRDRIRIRSVEETAAPMPPLSEPPLSQNEIETLSRWIQQGAPR